MKRVSFEVAKYLKEVGYPQDSLKDNIYVSEPNAPFSEVAYQPTYLDVWLWLWREKKIHIEINDNKFKIYDATEWIESYGYNLIEMSNNVFKDPEEAISAAIEYIVDNDLIK